MKIFDREPTLYIAVINALLLIVGTFGLNLFTQEQAGLAVIVVNAIFGVINAALVRPISPAVFTYAIGAILAFATSYGLTLPPETVVTVNAAVIPLLALLTRGQVSPVPTPVTNTTPEPTPEAAKVIAQG